MLLSQSCTKSSPDGILSSSCWEGRWCPFLGCFFFVRLFLKHLIPRPPSICSWFSNELFDRCCNSSVSKFVSSPDLGDSASLRSSKLFSGSIWDTFVAPISDKAFIESNFGDVSWPFLVSDEPLLSFSFFWISIESKLIFFRFSEMVSVP